MQMSLMILVLDPVLRMRPNFLQHETSKQVKHLTLEEKNMITAINTEVDTMIKTVRTEREL